MNCLLKHGIEGKIGGMIEVTERRGRRGKQLLDGKERMLELERGRTSSHSVDSWLCKRLWTRRNAHCIMNT
jgi:hypothetical protein